MLIVLTVLFLITNVISFMGVIGTKIKNERVACLMLWIVSVVALLIMYK